MSILKELNFVKELPAKQVAKRDPFVVAKDNMREALQAQIQLVKNPEFTIERRNKAVAPRKWWTEIDDKTFITLRVGQAITPISKSQQAITCATSELTATFEKLIAALDAGELDKVIATALKQRKSGK